ncbi:transmembrane 9 superfamily member 3, partial [Leptonychotes weddellii]|uniref:Transmembrane 9 superfamily member n=1 Tax=Leptonychotes weddellii TaxID=9713 RepID=A0A7F8Q6Z1_LEPWE
MAIKRVFVQITYRNAWHIITQRYKQQSTKTERLEQELPAPGRGPKRAQYQDKEEVVLWMNTVGPYHNRQETYKYFSLPFCVGSKKSISHYHETLGEALQGVELEFSGLDIKFKDDVMPATYCEIDLDKEKRDAFVYAIKNHYWYQMYIDDLPIWGIVGEADENGEDYYLWTYKKLEIGFNGNRIVDVNLTSEGKVKLVPNTKIQMSYSVKWKKSDVKFEDRFDKYLDPSFFQHRVAVCCICFFVILPLNLVGTILGRNLSGQPNFPCRVNAVPRPIPEKKWFMEPAVIVCLGGILPFGSIFIEMYFIFTSFWAYKIYYVYGFMMLVLVILCIVTVCVTIVCTYFLLNAEDYRWQWTSFLSAASTAIYVYMYSFYYYFFKTKMYGLFQTSFYFGYMAVFSTALGIMCAVFWGDIALDEEDLKLFHVDKAGDWIKQSAEEGEHST